MSELFERAAQVNRHAWGSFRRQRDEGLVPKHVDIAADIRAGKSCLSPQQRTLAGDVAGKRLLDLGCGDGYELLEWARLGADVVGVDNSPQQIAAAQRAATALDVPCRLIIKPQPFGGPWLNSPGVIGILDNPQWQRRPCIKHL